MTNEESRKLFMEFMQNPPVAKLSFQSMHDFYYHIWQAAFKAALQVRVEELLPSDDEAKGVAESYCFSAGQVAAMGMFAWMRDHILASANVHCTLEQQRGEDK